MATALKTSIKTLKKVLNENGYPNERNELRNYIVNRFGEQKQWYKYINHDKITEISKSNVTPVQCFDLIGNFIQEYSSIEE